MYNRNTHGACSMLIPALESEPVFCEEHNSCDSCTESLGAVRASKIVRDWMKG